MNNKTDILKRKERKNKGSKGEREKGRKGGGKQGEREKKRKGGKTERGGRGRRAGAHAAGGAPGGPAWWLAVEGAGLRHFKGSARRPRCWGILGGDGRQTKDAFLA